MKDANDLLLGGAPSKSAVFPKIGTVVEGTVISDPESREQTDLATGEIKRFKSGDPMMQVIIKLQTTQRDPDDPEDDGVRTLYVKNTMMKAVGKAMIEAGVKKIAPGGYLQVGYSGDIPPQIKGYSPTKVYVAKYTAPASNILTQAAAEPEPVEQAQIPFYTQHQPTNNTTVAPHQMTTLDQLKATNFSAQGQPQADKPPF